MRCSVTNITVEQAKAVGATSIKQLHSVPLIFAELTPAQIQQLEAQGATVSKVAKVQAAIQAPVAPPVPVAGAPTYTISQTLELVGFTELHQMFDPPIYGEGLNLAIIGTGIRETHELIGGQVVYRKNYTADSMEDGFDHDTGVASLALAVAPKVGILNMKALGNNGEGTEEAVVEAIDDCIGLIGTEYSPSVLNLSLGAPDDGNPDSALRVACRAAIEKGLYVGAAAGNHGPGSSTVTNPATEQYVFAVGSVSYLPDQDAYAVSDWSSRGPTKEGLVKPDAVMFGEDVIVASSSSDTATVAKSGTSFSMPIIAGFAVLYLQFWERRPEVVTRFPETPGLTQAVTLSELIDVHLPDICLRSGATKNNDVGWGMLYGPLMAKMMAPAVVDITSLVMPMVMVMMMGMMIKVVK